MTERCVRRRREIVSGLLLVALTGPAWAQAETFSITGVRTDRVILYKDCKVDPTTQITLTREQFQEQGPWPARTDESPLFFRVSRNGQTYCVKAFSVQTDKKVLIEKGRECDAKVAGRPPKTGAVRGVGEGC